MVNVRKNAFFRLMCAVIAILTACMLLPFDTFAVSPALNKTSLKMIVGSSSVLKVTGSDAAVRWSSSKKKVASVSSGGKVKALSAGTAVITASSDDFSLSCKVTVLDGSITAEENSVSIKRGSSKGVVITVVGSKQITAKVSDRDVASVSWGKWSGKDITVFIKGKSLGNAVITVYSDKNKNVSCKIKIRVTSGSDEILGDDEDYDEEYDEEYLEDDGLDGLSEAEQVLYYVNEAREENGVAPLELDEELCAVADLRAQELAENFSHTRPDGSSWKTAFEEFGVPMGLAGENISGGTKNAKEAVKRWMDSERHRANILNENYTKIGVGYYYDANARYSYFWVQEFSE